MCWEESRQGSRLLGLLSNSTASVVLDPTTYDLPGFISPSQPRISSHKNFYKLIGSFLNDWRLAFLSCKARRLKRGPRLSERQDPDLPVGMSLTRRMDRLDLV